MLLDIDTEILIKNVVKEIQLNGLNDDRKRRQEKLTRKLKELEYFEDLRDGKQH